MALTKALFRERIRDMIGDPLRVSGTATGGSLTTVVDTSKLTQADNYWSALQVFVVTTTDNNAPKGESKRVVTSSSSAKSVTVELPFSAAVESGDTYGIALISNARLDAIIGNILLDFSDFRPIKFNENLTVGGGEKRYSPASASLLRYVTKIEEYNAATSKDIVYRNWVWNADTKKVEFSDWISTSATLKLYGAKSHTLPAAEGDAMTYDAEDESALLTWCTAQVMLDWTEQQARDTYGNVKPKSITRGKVSETYGDQREKLIEGYRKTIEEIKMKYANDSSFYSMHVQSLPVMNIHGVDRSGVWLNH